MSFLDKGRYWEQLHNVHAYLKENIGGLEKGRFSKQPSILCLKRVDCPDKGRYYEQHYHLYGCAFIASMAASIIFLSAGTR